MNQTHLKPSRMRIASRSGISLLEIILAIAILGFSLAAIGQALRLGARAAVEARDLTTAQLLCESKMNMIAAGALPAESVDMMPADSLSAGVEWYYSVAVAPAELEGLIAVEVTVFKGDDPSPNPFSFSLVRWMQDPLLLFEDEMWPDDSLLGPGAGDVTF